MLKNLGYAGTYHDNCISVSALLENPLICGLEATSIVFSIEVRAKSGGNNTPRLENFIFYIMDEDNRLFNTYSAPYLKHNKEIVPDDEPVRRLNGLIHTSLRHEFLYQNLRIAFYYEPCKKIDIIELKH